MFIWSGCTCLKSEDGRLSKRDECSASSTSSNLSSRRPPFFFKKNNINLSANVKIHFLVTLFKIEQVTVEIQAFFFHIFYTYNLLKICIKLTLINKFTIEILPFFPYIWFIMCPPPINARNTLADVSCWTNMLLASFEVSRWCELTSLSTSRLLKAAGSFLKPTSTFRIKKFHIYFF